MVDIYLFTRAKRFAAVGRPTDLIIGTAKSGAVGRRGGRLFTQWKPFFFYACIHTYIRALTDASTSVSQVDVTWRSRRVVCYSLSLGE